MRDFGSIVGVSACVMRHSGHDFTVGHTVIVELIGDDPKRLVSLAFQEPSKEPSRCGAVSTGLDQNVDHVAVLVDGPPQILALAVDGNEGELYTILTKR